MKKILFVSSALVAVSGVASAANVINGNPFYSPAKGRFYNILTPIKLDTKFEQFYMSDEFGYGLTDNLSVMVATMGSYDASDNPQFGKWAWNNLEFGLDWSVSNNPNSMADIYASVKQIYDTRQHLETVAYNWTLGTRIGRMGTDWTLAGVVELDYLNDDVSDYDYDTWAMTVGVMGQKLLNTNWNLVASLNFNFDLYKEYYDGEELVLEFGVNYNVSRTKYLGLYVSKDVVRDFDDAPVNFKIQFGADF
ncbi:MAG: hypothetical protein ACLRFK_02420 [Alphaproteobacteria bacterium]